VNPLLERANSLLPVERMCPSIRGHLPLADLYEQAFEESDENESTSMNAI
jgi:hypothetical protein